MSELINVWYSKEQDIKFGHVIYKLENGEEVKVTNASNSPNADDFNFADSVYLGKGTFYKSTTNFVDIDDLTLEELKKFVDEKMSYFENIRKEATKSKIILN